MDILVHAAAWRLTAAATSAISSATAGRSMSTCGFLHIPASMPYRGSRQPGLRSRHACVGLSLDRRSASRGISSAAVHAEDGLALAIAEFRRACDVLAAGEG